MRLRHSSKTSERPWRCCPSRPRPFVVMLGDDLVDITDDTVTTLTKQLMNDHDETHVTICSVAESSPWRSFHACRSLLYLKERASTDSIALKPLSEGTCTWRRSDLAIIGRYADSEIFQIWKTKTRRWKWNQLTDARPNGCPRFKGKRYDVGDKFGFMKTSIDYALKHPRVKDDLQTIHHQPWKTIRKLERNPWLFDHKRPDYSGLFSLKAGWFFRLYSVCVFLHREGKSVHPHHRWYITNHWSWDIQ